MHAVAASCLGKVRPSLTVRAAVLLLVTYSTHHCLQVVAPREGSPLTFSMIEEFSVGTFSSMISPEASPDVRQVCLWRRGDIRFALCVLLFHVKRSLFESMSVGTFSSIISPEASPAVIQVCFGGGGGGGGGSGFEECGGSTVRWWGSPHAPYHC
jgi:hypothetical protein